MENRENKILVPVDFGEQSLIALDQSYNIARMVNAEIYILHVITENNALWGLFSKKEQSDFEEKLKIKLTEFAGFIEQKSEVKVILLVEKGKLVETIINTAERLKVKFLIVGTSSSTDIKQKVIGSNALRIVREATFPVITIKGKHHRAGCKNIVLPLDLTKETREKVSYAIYFAKYFNSVVHAVTLNTTSDTYIMNHLKMQLEQVSNYIKSQGVECTQNFINSDSGNENMCNALLDFSHKVEADLIMIVTQQETEVIKYFVGSLAKEIIHNSDIPVMSIVPKNR
ncbi:MAG: universal stress protein [Ignavibacteria bacterium]|nr:universal stress protein [Ignavibacteria bacterium]